MNEIKKVYVVDIDKTNGLIPVAYLTDEDFKAESIRQDLVFTLKEFQNNWNNQGGNLQRRLNRETQYIRILGE